MRWDDEHDSPDVIDRRGEGPARPEGGNLGGLFFLIPYLIRTPFGWVILIGAVIVYFARGVIGGMLHPDQSTRSAHGGGVTETGRGEDKEAHFVAFVLDDVQHTWEQTFAAEGHAYRHAKLVLYTDSTNTGCGYGQAATGPFYCPADERVYIDLGFFRELSGKLGARGQFAQGYVVAHEIGHHVQKLLGLSQQVDSARHTSGADGASVRLELQADCFAGIWAKSTDQRSLLEQGDIDSALGAAAAVGDDRLQRMSRGTVSPESWTHGSSEERMRWFRRGFTSGTIASCDTFHAKTL